MVQRKTVFLILVMILLATIQSSYAAETGLTFKDTPSLVRPGKTEKITFLSNFSDKAVLTVQDLQGKLLGTAIEFTAQEGQNALFWDGTLPGEDIIPAGEYELLLIVGEHSISKLFRVGEESPRLFDVRISDPNIVRGTDWSVTAIANLPGILHVKVAGDNGIERDILSAKVPAGSLIVPWDGTLHDGQPQPEGTYSISLSLSDEEGFFGNAHHYIINIETKEILTQPVSINETLIEQETALESEHYKIPSLQNIAPENQGSDYWSLPIGLWDEEAIWKAMMQPMTIVDGPDQRQTYKLRLKPDKSTARENIVGEITFISQSVHVINTMENGWTLVESYNSSYGPDNRSRRGYGNTDELIQGYIETSLLKTVTPRDDYGLLIDKFNQELYVFKEGKLFTTLTVSTGKPTIQQPWNETPSGEYVMISRVGDFLAGNLVCSMGMRINGGSLIHEVPYMLNVETGYQDYSIQERVLGEKASHGCIRVQRKNNKDGINMAWLWNNIKVNTKVLVWDDEARYVEYPQDSMPLYYNPTGGQYYHTLEKCPSIKDRYLPLEGHLTYVELDDEEYKKLTPCPFCKPPQRKSVIQENNSKNGFED